MSTRRTFDRPERALNILQREKLDDLASRRTTEKTLRFAYVNKWCVFINAAGGTGAARMLYDHVRPGQTPRMDWRTHALVTTQRTADQMRALAGELNLRSVLVEEAALLALAGRERAEEAGMLW